MSADAFRFSSTCGPSSTSFISTSNWNNEKHEDRGFGGGGRVGSPKQTPSLMLRMSAFHGLGCKGYSFSPYFTDPHPHKSPTSLHNFGLHYTLIFSTTLISSLIFSTA